MRLPAVTLVLVLSSALAHGQAIQPAGSAERTDAPRLDPPWTEAPGADAPPPPPAQTEAPSADVSQTDVPTAEVPTADVPEAAWSERCLRRPPGWYGSGVFWEPPLIVEGGGGGRRPRLSQVAHDSAPANGPHGAAPVKAGSSNGGSGGGGKGGAELAALLVIAAVAVAVALPIIIYNLDEPASPDVLGRFECPQLDFDVRGGVAGDRVVGLGAPLFLRARVADGNLGLVAQLELSPWSRERESVDGSVAAWLRFTPTEHLELGLTAGYRSQVLRGVFHPGFEAALPHEYVFSRQGAGQVGLEVRPAVFVFPGGVDLSLDLALRIPVGELVSVLIGGRIFTVDALTGAGGAALGGLSVRL